MLKREARDASRIVDELKPGFDVCRIYSQLPQSAVSIDLAVEPVGEVGGMDEGGDLKNVTS